MAYDVGNIIRLQTNISPNGLGVANFGSGMFFCLDSERPASETADTFKTYDLDSFTDAFATSTHIYEAVANHWFTSAPTGPRDIKVWFVNSEDADWSTTLNKAANATYWFINLFDEDTYAVKADVLEIAIWSLANQRYFPNCQTGTACAAIRDQNDDTDIASQLQATGNRFAHTIAHATDPYAGVSLMKWYARVNYEATDSTITGNLKTTQGVVSEELEASEYAAMKTKNVSFYTTVSSAGEEDVGNWIVGQTHSSNGEYPDDIFNVAAFSNYVQVYSYNYLRGQTTKAPQTPKGYAGLLREVEKVGLLFSDPTKYSGNGYLGPRNYTDPDTSEDAYTDTGFVMLSQANDILDITSTARAAREAAVVRYRLYPAGAIQAVDIIQTINNS